MLGHCAKRRTELRSAILGHALAGATDRQGTEQLAHSASDNRGDTGKAILKLIHRLCKAATTYIAELFLQLIYLRYGACRQCL
jgi:hypothetical protein